MVYTLLAQLPPAVYTTDEVLSPYIYVFYAAFIVTFAFTPIMRAVALNYGIVDQPDKIRKMHSTPVAYLGGLAVFLGWIAGLAMSQFTLVHSWNISTNKHVLIPGAIVIAAFFIVALGLWDDLRRIKPSFKILGQVGAAVLLLLGGVGTRCTAPMWAPINHRLLEWYGMGPLPDALTIATSSIVVIAVVVFCCNATNLMDGLDGLCGGVTAIIAAGFLFIAVHLAVHGIPDNSNWDSLRVVLAFALLGAVLAFVPFNFNPASIFMGDAGSMFLGFACATLIILMAQAQSKWFLAGMVMFALPVLDTALAFTRRFVNGRPLFSADRYHFHHQLVARGLSVRTTVIISYALAIGFAILGGAIVFMRTRYAVAFYLVIFGSIIVAAYKMGMVHEKPRIVTRRPLSPADFAAGHSELEASNVLEVRDADQPVDSATLSPAPPGSWGQ